MKLTKCEKKHFYDADKFDACPHCEALLETKQDSSAQGAFEKPSTGSPSVSPKKDTLSPRTGAIWDQGVDPKTSNLTDEFNADGEASIEAVQEHKDHLSKDMPIAPTNFAEETANSIEKSTAVVEESIISGEEPPTATATSVVLTEEPNTSAGKAVASVEKSPIEQPITADSFDRTPPSIVVNSKPPTPHETQNTLQSQVEAVVSHGSTEDLKTMAFYDFADIEPVVGWLVCIMGEYLGQSFNLKAGQNFIGRALTMDIPLAKDTNISRDKHAIVTYDPENRVFFVQPGIGSGLTYLNGNLLLAHQAIKAYEKIKVGKSEFIFVPCCGEQFTWEDYMQ